MATAEDTSVISQVLAFPAVPLQQRIWNLRSTTKVDPAWNVAVRFQLLGALSPERFQQALDIVVADTEILRTRFALIDGQLKQLVSEAVSVPVAHFDYSDSLNFEEDLASLSLQEAEAELDMEQHPLLRVVLVRRHAEAHYLLITAHHSIMDGYSVGLLFDALIRSYEVVGDPSKFMLPVEPALQFADYTLWLKTCREGPEYQEHAAYWESALESVPASKPQSWKSATRQGTAHIESIVLPRSLTDATQSLCQRLNATFPQIALTIFACVADKLNDYIGVPVACRTDVQLEAMIGPFVNYLPFRISATATSTFEQLVAMVAETFREALLHSEFRYEDMLEMKGLGDHSLFDSVFICQRDFVRPRHSDGIEFTAIPSVSPGALHQLTVFLVERSDGWRLSCETDDRSAADYGSSLLHRYKAMMQAVCADMAISIEALAQQACSPGKITDLPKEELNEALPTASFPMSPTQERYWALNQIDPGNNHLNLHMRYAVEGVLDQSAFKASVDALMRRHDLLRTSFSGDNGIFLQHVTSAIEVPIRYHAEPEETFNTDVLNSLLRVEQEKPFILERGPLWSVLIVTSGERSFISLTLSHSIGDGWSCGILMRELLSLYEATLVRRPASLGPLPYSFGEFASRDSYESATPAFKARLNYWEALLEQPLPLLRLPADRNEQFSVIRVQETRVIDPMLSGAVIQLARDHGVTPATVYAATYRSILLKYTGFSDLVIASPTANRIPGSEAIIGPFADSLLLRADIGLTFADALLATQHSLLAAVENTVPLQYLMERIRRSEAEHGAAIPLGFMYQDAFIQDLVGEHVTLRAMDNPIVEKSYDWHLAVINRDEEVSLEFTAPESKVTHGLATMILEDFELSLSEYAFAPRKRLASVIGSTDKVKRICDRVQAPEGRSTSPSRTPPKRPALDVPPSLVREMVTVWQAAFGRAQINENDDFFALGGHSLLLARLQVAIEKRFNHKIVVADILAAPTCELLTERIIHSQDHHSKLRSRVIPLQPEGEETPLFVISQSLIVRELAGLMKPRQPTFTIQFSPEDVEQLGDSATMQQVAALYIQHMRTARPTGPYRLGGWCVSAWVAYEMAQQLKASGDDVQLVLILDAWAPNFWRDLRGLGKLLGRTSYYLHRTSFVVAQLFTRGESGTPFTMRLEAFWDRIQNRIKALYTHPIDQAVEPFNEQVAAFDQMMDSATSQYRAVPYNDNRVLVFRSTEQPCGGTLPDDMGWSKYLPQSVTITSVPGDHTGMFAGAGAKLMSACIAGKVAGQHVPRTHEEALAKGAPSNELKMTSCSF